MIVSGYVRSSLNLIAPIIDDSCPDVNAPLELKATGPCETLTSASVERVSLATDLLLRQ